MHLLKIFIVSIIIGTGCCIGLDASASPSHNLVVAVQQSTDSVQSASAETSGLDKVNGNVPSINPSDSVSQVLENQDVQYEQTADTTALPTYNLDEVVIVASRETRLKDGIAYTPDKNQKKFATDGVSLLARMMIPSLNVNFMNNSVQTTSGEEVSYFINGLPATAEDVAVIAPTDVDKVEVLEKPSDAKFLGAKNVINYIVTKYLWGGYTKVRADGSAPSWRGGGFVNSGFTYKRMTYSIYVNSRYDQDFSNSESIQNLNIDGNDYSVTTINNRPKGRTTSETGYFSALYQTEKVQFKNRLSLSHSLTPWETNSGLTIYDTPTETIEALSQYGTHSKTLNPGWDGNLYVSLPHNTALYVTASTLFRLNNSHQLQKQFQNNDLIFENDYQTKETGNNSTLDIWFTKNFSQKHQLSINAYGKYDLYNLSYEAPVGEGSRIENIYSKLEARYTYSWNTGRLSVASRMIYNKSDIRHSQYGISKFIPSGYIIFTWNPGRNQQFSADINYASGRPNLAQVNPTRIQRNLLLWEEGNPNLGVSPVVLWNLSYSWWHQNISFNVYLKSFYQFDLPYQTASLNENGSGLTLGYNGGVDWFENKLGASVTWNISKEFGVTGSGYIYNIKKTYPVNKNKFRPYGYIRGQWSHNHYMLLAYVESPMAYYSFDGYGRETIKYGVAALAVYGNWAIQMNVNNPFNKRKHHDAWGRTPNNLYSYNIMSYSNLSSTDVNLSVTYTIRYGRKQQDQKIESVTKDQSLMK